MREPPPSPLETTARILLKDHRLYKPYRPSLGFQKLCFIWWGLRGNDPGGYALPRSNRQTRKPASLSLYVITEPPNPEPITTASKCSPSISNSYRARLARGFPEVHVLGPGTHTSTEEVGEDSEHRKRRHGQQHPDQPCKSTADYHSKEDQNRVDVEGLSLDLGHQEVAF